MKYCNRLFTTTFPETGPLLSVFFPDPLRRGPLPMAVGLSILLAAQVWPWVPIVSAIMLIGLGATVTLLVCPVRQEWTALLSLAVYAALGCFAGAAQTHAAMMGRTGRLEVLQMADLLLAVALLTHLVRLVVRRCRIFNA